MTKCYLDSNVLIYLKDSESLEYKKSKQLITQLISDNIEMQISSLCLDEYIHEIGKSILKKYSQKSYFKQLNSALASILELPRLTLVNPSGNLKTQLEITHLMEAFTLRPRDAYHLLTMKENKIDSFATFDNDFKKVFKAKLLTPAL